MQKALVGLCAICMVSGVARANLITNPSFETPVVPSANFQVFNSGDTGITGWTATGPANRGVAVVSTTFAQNRVTFQAFDGSQWLDLTGFNSNSTEGVTQTAATTSGTNYVLTFYIGNTTGGGIFGSTSTDALKINGTQVGTFTNSNTSTSRLDWQQFTYSFAATGSSTTIEFDNLDPGTDNSNGLDLIDLEVGAASGVPEPASLALAGAALLLFAFRMRRKK